jgi:hypothetical protein
MGKRRLASASKEHVKLRIHMNWLRPRLDREEMTRLGGGEGLETSIRLGPGPRAQRPTSPPTDFRLRQLPSRGSHSRFPGRGYAEQANGGTRASFECDRDFNAASGWTPPSLLLARSGIELRPGSLPDYRRRNQGPSVRLLLRLARRPPH